MLCFLSYMMFKKCCLCSSAFIVFSEDTNIISLLHDETFDNSSEDVQMCLFCVYESCDMIVGCYVRYCLKSWKESSA